MRGAGPRPWDALLWQSPFPWSFGEGHFFYSYNIRCILPFSVSLLSHYFEKVKEEEAFGL